MRHSRHFLFCRLGTSTLLLGALQAFSLVSSAAATSLLLLFRRSLFCAPSFGLEADVVGSYLFEFVPKRQNSCSFSESLPLAPAAALAGPPD